MNLNDYRTRIAGIIGLDTSNSGYERTLADAWVYEGIIDFLRRTKCHKKLISMALIADEPEYTLDADILAMEKLWFDSATSGVMDKMLEPIDSAEIFAMQAYTATNVGVLYYSLEGSNLLLLYPTPSSSADSIKGIYVPLPSAMSVTSDAPSSTAYGGIPVEFHPVILDYALWKAADFDDDQSSQVGLQYQAQYEKGVQDAIKSLNLKAGPRLAPARWGRGKRGWRIPATPGTDWGG